MPKMIVSIDGVVIKEVQLTKDRTTLGRRPYNDIVIDNLAVSGEHAVLQMSGNEVYLEDLNSTNGTYVNGKAVKKQLLQNNDTVEIGKYKIKYLLDDSTADYEKTAILRPAAAQPPLAAMAFAPMPAAFGAAPPPTFQPPRAEPQPSSFGGLDGTAGTALIKVLNGAAAGREVTLTKVVTTVGKPGVQVASSTKRPGGYVIAHVEGLSRPSINGMPLASDIAPLKNGDLI